MVECVLRFSDLETFLGKMSELGIAVRPEGDIESRCGRVMTPPLALADGNLALTIRLEDDEAALIPDITSPDFLCDWRSDEVEEEDVYGEIVKQPLPWPEYGITVYDIDGNPAGIRMQGVGKIA